jgi:hypothetical protein
MIPCDLSKLIELEIEDGGIFYLVTCDRDTVDTIDGVWGVQIHDGTKYVPIKMTKKALIKFQERFEDALNDKLWDEIHTPPEKDDY